MEWVNIEKNKEYPILGVSAQGKGVFINRIAKGSELTMKKYQKSQAYHLFYCKVRTVKGQRGVVYPEYEDSYGSSNMQYLNIKQEKILPRFLELLLKLKKLTDKWDQNAIGADGRHFTLKTLLDLEIPLPPLAEQQRIVDQYHHSIQLAQSQRLEAQQKKSQIESYLMSELGIEFTENKQEAGKLFWVESKKVSKRDLRNNDTLYISNKYDITSLSQDESLSMQVTRGKSPKYKENTGKYILNQKCNRRNFIDMDFVKEVDDIRFSSVNQKLLTEAGDIIVNSTGEGTLGRSTCITNENIGLLYDSHMLLIKANQKKLDGGYLTYIINSRLGQDQVNASKGAQSTNQTELGVENLKNITFPLPPLEIQQSIVATIHDLETDIASLQLLSVQNETQALSQFEGELFS